MHESSAMELSHVNNWTSPTAPRLNSSANVLPVSTSPSLDPASSFNSNNQESSPDNLTTNGICNIGESNNLASDMDTSVLTPLTEKMNITSIQNKVDTSEGHTTDIPEVLMCSATTAEVSHTCTGFLEPDRVSESHISTTLVSTNRHGCRMLLLHREEPVQLCCVELKVHFGLSTKFLDHAGQPKLSIAFAAPASLCQVLDACEHVARKSLLDFGSSSEWRPLIKKYCFTSSPIVRLNIPTSANEDASTCLAEIYQKELCGNIVELDFRKFNASELESLFAPGTIIDAFFCVDIYDYQQYAGIRLVAKRLIVHSR